MLQSQLPRRQLAGIFWLLLVAVGAALALANLYAGLFVVALGTLAVLAQVRADALAPRRAAAPRRARGQQAAWGRSERLVLADAAGEPRAAFVLHHDAESGYAAVLTSEGYALVNAAGEKIPQIGR